jgi:hypothetical protein
MNRKITVLVGGGSSPASGASSSAPARELAQRLSGTVEILLLWHSEIDRLELSVRDVATGSGFQIDVEPSDAIDAFNHPYAYAAKQEQSRRVLRAEEMIRDG